MPVRLATTGLTVGSTSMCRRTWPVAAPSRYLPASAAIPYPAVGNYPKPGQWCTDRPSFIVMAAKRDPFVLAHELMHVIQFSHRYATCAEPIAFWDEGGADWAGDYVYPDSQYELHNHGFLLKSPAAFSSPTNRSYEYWPFWMMLHHTAGIDVLKSVFTQLKTKQAIPAVGAAIPGGWAKQVPRLALTVWNQEPIGTSGWSIDEGFKNWDNWTGVPEMAKPTNAKLNGATQQTLPLPKTSSTLQDSFEALAIGGIQEVDINDPKIREIQFQNALAGKPAHVDAMVQYEDGSWELKNWSGRPTSRCASMTWIRTSRSLWCSRRTSARTTSRYLATRSACVTAAVRSTSRPRVGPRPAIGAWQGPHCRAAATRQAPRTSPSPQARRTSARSSASSRPLRLPC